MSLVDIADHRPPGGRHARGQETMRSKSLRFLPLHRRALHGAAPEGEGGPAQLSVQQYLRHMDDVLRAETKSGVMAMLVSVTRQEVQSLIQATAKAKGRYFASLLESAEGKRLPGAGKSEELRRLRESYQELDRGLGMLREAIEAEVVQVRGVGR
jgi:hypothetical protein